MQSFHRRSSEKRGERGFVLVTMIAASIALIAVLGLAVDVGRIFIVKNETQSYCDAAAIAASLQLDGTTTGITNATAAVTNSTNKWNLDSTSVASPSVSFGTTSAGPWVTSPNPATGYLYTKVTATTAMGLYFLPVVVRASTQNVVSTAIAGQVDITSFPRGLAPYTAVAESTTGPLFGLTVGVEYDLQWPNRNANGFIKNPCAGDTSPLGNADTRVLVDWTSANSGYWGSTSNSTIEQEVLDLIQLQPVSVGTNIMPVLTNGNKASEGVYLDERAMQDTDTTDQTVGTPTTNNTYLGNPLHNGRRLLSVPIVNPTSAADTTVVGYGQFLLRTNNTGNYYQKIANGNDPYCAVYAGPYSVGSSHPGVGGTTGASFVKLVQ